MEVCLAGDKMQRLQKAEELTEHIKAAQDSAFVMNGLARVKLGENEVSNSNINLRWGHKICTDVLQWGVLYIVPFANLTPAIPMH